MTEWNKRSGTECWAEAQVAWTLMEVTRAAATVNNIVDARKVFKLVFYFHVVYKYGYIDIFCAHIIQIKNTRENRRALFL